MKRRLYRVDRFGNRTRAALWERILHRIGLLRAPHR